MDMWPAFIESTRTHVPDAEAKIVFDRSTSRSTWEKAVDHGA